MSSHRIHLDSVVSGPVTVIGDEAHHALRVKRLEKGDRVEVLDGRGKVGVAIVSGSAKSRVGEWEMLLEIGEVCEVSRVVPHVEVCSGVPKGPRVEDLIDQLSQVGVAVWRPLVCERTVVEPREGKIERLRRAASEAAKQCGRAWLMEIGEAIQFHEAIRGAAGARVIVADGSGEVLERRAAGETRVRLVVGPEGGLSAGELSRARGAGAEVCRFGVHVMRTETAAVVGAGILLAASVVERGKNE